MDHPLELGIDTFGDVTEGPDGALRSHADVLRDVVEEAVEADRLGLDVIGIGEHHRADFAVSSPETVLAAIAARTERIHLASAVTVLSSDDPVRVFQRFSTLDALSSGRAEVIVGRGSFTESFPLFGYDLGDYEELFEERLDLFVQLLRRQPVTWSGATRASLHQRSVYPTPERPLTAWVGVGGSPSSVIRAARYAMPLVIAIIGGSSARFAPLVQRYHRALDAGGSAPLPVAVHSPGLVAATDAEALELLYPHWREMRDRIGRERGWGPAGPSEFTQSAGPDGALYVGSPETVAAKIVATARTLGLSRFSMKYSAGRLPHAAMVDSIGLLATEVAPRVRDALAGG